MANPYIVDAEMNAYDGISVPNEMKDEYGWMGTVDTQAIAAYARRNGYDGAIVRNVRESTGYGDDFIAFDSKQIKSATENIGTFDGTNSDIRFSTNPITASPEIRAAMDEARKLFDSGVHYLTYYNRREADPRVGRGGEVPYNIVIIYCMHVYNYACIIECSML